MILDINVVILGKYIDDYLYSARKMFQNTKEIAQFCVFSDSAQIFEKVENLNEMRQMAKEAGRPAVVMAAGVDPALSEIKILFDFEYLQTQNEVFGQLKDFIYKNIDKIQETPLIIFSSSRTQIDEAFSFLTKNVDLGHHQL